MPHLKMCVSLQAGDDSAFRQDLLSRMGVNRVQYLQLMEALIYYEDIAGL